MKEASRLAGSGFQSGRGSGTVTPDRAHSPTARYAIPQRAMNSSGASGRNSPTFSSPRGSPANGQSATSPTKDGVSLSRILGANKDPTKPPFFLHKKQPSPSNVPPWVVTRNDNFSRSPTRETGLTMGNANGLAHSVAPTPGSNTTTVLSSNNAKTDSASSGGNSVVSLRKQLAEREVRIKDLEAQCDNFRELLQKRDAQVEALQREVHKLKSVLQDKSSGKSSSDGTHHVLPKKQGVSAESSAKATASNTIEIKIYEKDFRSKQLIKSAILENDFLKNLDASQVKEIVDAMIPKDVPSGVHIIREGDAGSHLYVCAEGELEVTKNGTVLGKMGPGRAFGELAILYNCRRTASIKAIQPSKVWALERRVFQQVMMKTGLRRTEDTSKFLRSVPLLQNLSEAHIRKITDVLEVTFFPGGTYITRQGTQGDSFYIISSGKVKVTQTRDGEGETEIRTLARGDYFGEQALLKEEVRTANVIAIEPGVECLEVDREAFVQFIGDLREIQEKEYNVPPTSPMRPPATSADSKQFEEFPDMVLDDLDLVGTLGIGGFGRVELVQYSKQKGTTFALKCLKKKHIVDTQQQEHVMGEKRIMLTCRHLFIARLYRTFKDDKYLYMLMEACLGGELWTILRDRSRFDEQSTRFYTACVVEALGYLHSKGIIYRDLKPENLLLDAKGYIKMVDFGFSKYVGPFEKTWTFCGTPEYVAPEVILNKGHDKAVDYWSLGVFMYELLSGAPPFTSSDPMKTYNIILRGIDSINFPRYMSRNSIALIRKLCRDSPAERLGLGRQGVGEIRKHKFFTGFDWDGLNSRSLPPPIFPSVKSPVDISNFDAYPKETSLPPDDLSGWDKDF